MFGIPDPALPITYTTYIGLRRRLRVVYSRASPMLKPFRAKENSTSRRKGPKNDGFGSLSQEHPLQKIAESLCAEGCEITHAQNRNFYTDLDKILRDGRYPRPSHLHKFW